MSDGGSWILVGKRLRVMGRCELRCSLCGLWKDPSGYYLERHKDKDRWLMRRSHCRECHKGRCRERYARQRAAGS